MFGDGVYRLAILFLQHCSCSGRNKWLCGRPIQPAFESDYANQRIRFEAEYLGSNPSQSLLLPPEYQQNYVSFMLCSKQCQSSYVYFVIPKNKSDVIFELQAGQPLRVTAQAEPFTLISRITGDETTQLLLVVDTIEIEEK